MLKQFRTLKRTLIGLSFGLAALGLSACDPSATGVSGNVGVGVYYDSMLWNDYYYGGARPPHRPDRPRPPGARPPIEPPGGVRPPIGRPPGARPPSARPPIHRPAGGGRRR